MQACGRWSMQDACATNVLCQCHCVQRYALAEASQSSDISGGEKGYELAHEECPVTSAYLELVLAMRYARISNYNRTGTTLT
jgi:hypothetical protein